MESWQIGLIAIVIAGLALILFGALRDRRLNERRRREMHAPPQRDIPGFSPTTPSPNYLSALEARRPPAGATSTELTETERSQLRTAIDRSDLITVDVGYASADLVTDTATGWSVLHRPNVLVSAAPVSVFRELVGIIERQLPTGRPLVVVAPEIEPELIVAFAVNHIQQVITILPVVAVDEAVRRRIADATHSTPLSSIDLRSGFIVPGQLGSCTTWISTPSQSHLLADQPSEATAAVEPSASR